MPHHLDFTSFEIVSGAVFNRGKRARITRALWDFETLAKMEGMALHLRTARASTNA